MFDRNHPRTGGRPTYVGERQNTLSGRNCTETRGPALRDLGDGVLPGALAGAAHHDQVAVAHLEGDRVAAAARPEGQPTRVAERHDGDHRVGVLAATDRVAVPGHGVAAVAVEAAPGGHERLAELGQVVRGQRLAGRRQERVGELLVDDVGVDQPGYVDDPVVHRSPLGPPRHVGDQPLEHVVGADHEVAQDVDPRAAGQGGALGTVERPHAGCRRDRPVEEAALEVHVGSVRRDRTDVRVPVRGLLSGGGPG